MCIRDSCDIVGFLHFILAIITEYLMAFTIKNCNCSAVDMSHYVYRNLQETKISKLQLIIALYVDYIW